MFEDITLQVGNGLAISLPGWAYCLLALGMATASYAARRTVRWALGRNYTPGPEAAAILSRLVDPAAWFVQSYTDDGVPKYLKAQEYPIQVSLDRGNVWLGDKQFFASGTWPWRDRRAVRKAANAVVAALEAAKRREVLEKTLGFKLK
jgi:hypothetical protein